MVIRRPRITIRLLTTRTNRFMRWKKSASWKKLPRNSKSSGMLSRPGELVAAAPFAPPAGVVPPAAAFEPLAELTAFDAPWAAWPGALCAGGAPGAVGPEPPLGGVEPVEAGAAPGLVLRVPALTSVNLMPVPREARSSCTSRLGMSTEAGIDLPSLITVA